MGATADVVVVGSGINGVSTAFHLAKQGAFELFVGPVGPGKVGVAHEKA